MKLSKERGFTLMVGMARGLDRWSYQPWDILMIIGFIGVAVKLILIKRTLVYER